MKKENQMETIQIRLTSYQRKAVEKMVRNGKYPSKSEAIRAAVKRMLDESEKNGRENNLRV